MTPKQLLAALDPLSTNSTEAPAPQILRHLVFDGQWQLAFLNNGSNRKKREKIPNSLARRLKIKMSSSGSPTGVKFTIAKIGKQKYSL